MIWFVTHHIIQYLFPDNLKFSEKKKNLTTFLVGIIFYAIISCILYKYSTNTENMFLHAMNKILIVIVLADAVAMSIIYRHYWNRNIISEVVPEGKKKENVEEKEMEETEPMEEKKDDAVFEENKNQIVE